MSERITTDQLRELLEQDHRDGLGGQLQQLLIRATPDPLDRLWTTAGRPLQLAKTKEQYRQQFPECPEWGTRIHRRHTLLLPVEPRVSFADLAMGFQITQLDTFDPADAAEELPQWKKPHWMWCQPGTWFLNWEPKKVRGAGCAAQEYPCSALEGLHIRGLTGPYPFVTDCPRSVLRERRGFCMCFVLHNGPRLGYRQDDIALPDCGSASRCE